MSENEPSTLIYISARVGGEDRSNAAVTRALRELATLTAEESGLGDASDIRIDLVFDVSGPVLATNYQGIRTGRLSRRGRLLQVQIAVPEGLRGSDVWGFFARALPDVRDLVRDFVDDHRLGLSVDAVSEAIERVLYEVRYRADSDAPDREGE